MDFISDDIQPPQASSKSPSQSQEKPQLRDLLRHLMPLASNWKTLGALLDLKDCYLDIIQANNQNQSVECLRETLSLLLRQTEPTCTWQAVAEAVELLNPLKAKEIRDKFVK